MHTRANRVLLSQANWFDRSIARRAVEGCLRPFAAHFVKAPSLTMSIVSPFLDVSSSIVVARRSHWPRMDTAVTRRHS